MTLKLIGAGVGRTGTMSLRAALSQLFGTDCYHMVSVFENPGHVAMWQAAVDGQEIDWRALFDGCDAAVDWPVSAFWPELMEEYPDALVLLSTRDSALTWWTSASNTIFNAIEETSESDFEGWAPMVFAMMRERFTADFRQEQPAMKAYERHNAQVRERVPADRLLEWQPGDGWEPICERLGLAIPNEPFPHTNTTEEFNARAEVAPDQPDP